MHIIKKLLLLLVLIQLGACAVISKDQCLNADWRKIGYDVGSNGNIDKNSAFEKRKRTCEKHNAIADWKQFELGHSDGIVSFCQLDNAIALGAKGISKAINKNICSERDYPGFRDAFRAGYKLYALNTRVNESDSGISLAYNQINHHKTSILRINKRLNSKETSQKERNRLIKERQKIRSDIKYLARDIELYRQHLHHDIYARDEYADYLYNDYINSLNDQFIDPRNNGGFNIEGSRF